VLQRRGIGRRASSIEPNVGAEIDGLFFATAESGVDHDEVAQIAQWNVPVKGRRAVAVGGLWQPSCVCLDAGTATIRVDAIRRWPAGVDAPPQHHRGRGGVAAGHAGHEGVVDMAACAP